ncbi:NfeD family protein [Piscibacillus halophilus]|uniref:NfeD family protein n=1 Tax=Piscibacillus halophilus TaxID=571933 RepID=UPI00158AFDFB|nr:NfeD family protein [Piscibacillus halophilus]
MMILESYMGVLIITFLAMFFMLGELMVKLKGLGMILGIGFITFYFLGQSPTYNVWLMGFVFIIGISLIVVDGKWIGDGTLGVIGLVLVLLSVAFAASTWIHALYSVAGVLLGSFSSLFLMKAFPRRDMWTKVALLDQLSSEAGYNSLNETYIELLNQTGETITVLRPSGTIRVNGEEYSAISKSKWVDKGKKVKVVVVDGTKIEVEEVE